MPFRQQQVPAANPIIQLLCAYGAGRTFVRAALEKAHGIGEFKGTASDTVLSGK